ncbi:hypothetical protein BV20DRAFT_520661 [Pilatotrama ljubarskyi]|nr:hypothetical protein BV20DRAFT_520661 [Pilatotrama ljubarskyi]
MPLVLELCHTQFSSAFALALRSLPGRYALLRLSPSRRSNPVHGLSSAFHHAVTLHQNSGSRCPPPALRTPGVRRPATVFPTSHPIIIPFLAADDDSVMAFEHHGNGSDPRRWRDATADAVRPRVLCASHQTPTFSEPSYHVRTMYLPVKRTLELSPPLRTSVLRAEWLLPSLPGAAGGHLRPRFVLAKKSRARSHCGAPLLLPPRFCLASGFCGSSISLFAIHTPGPQNRAHARTQASLERRQRQKTLRCFLDDGTTSDAGLRLPARWLEMTPLVPSSRARARIYSNNPGNVATRSNPT